MIYAIFILSTLTSVTLKTLTDFMQHILAYISIYTYIAHIETETKCLRW